jgi:hypothetical protein
MSIVVAILTAPINLVIDFLFVDVLSAPSVDDLKMRKQNEMNQSRLSKIASKVGGTVRRASVGAIQVARKRLGVNRTNTRTGSSMQIPESTMEAHELAVVSSKDLIEERKGILEREQSSRHDNRSQVLLERHQKKKTTKAHRSDNQKGVRDSSRGELDELDQQFYEFVTDMNEQRRLLKPAMRERYDSQWG